MELIYLYINQSDTKFIEGQGFNFSPNYHFYVEQSEGQYILKQEEREARLPENFFDENGCISNITAIVGENGSGKTTLLNCISQFDGSVRKQPHDDKYHDFLQEKYEQDKQIAIYCNRGKLTCYHNIEHFISRSNIECINLYEDSHKLRDIIRENLDFRGISIIKLTNSMYTFEDGVSTHERISEISLNVNSLKTLKKIFYDKKCKNTKSCAGGYYEFQDILYEYRKTTDVQQILDMLYLEYIKSTKAESIFAHNIQGNISVKFQSFRNCLDDKFGSLDAKYNENNSLKRYVDVVNKLLSKFDRTILKKDVFCILYQNLLFEIITCLFMDKFEGESHINSKEKLVDYLRGLILELNEKKSEYARYFSDAFQEISEYEQCLSSCREVHCVLPLSDWAFATGKDVEYGSKNYDGLLEQIKKSFFEREYSFVLKYINIGGLSLASGERAMLNFFSWLYLVPYFRIISNDVYESLHDNVLLLIDEIDLYCHPSWQQKLVKSLIKEINVLYAGKKVQIIFTTHSPIVLSDIPECNVIFLKRKEGKCYIDNKKNHTETFGANIYRLFDDAFFLEERGQIGEFAKNKIQNIIKRIQPFTNQRNEVIYPELTKEEIEQTEKEISLIGESIIRDKLFEMLFKCKYKDYDLKQKRIKIYEEKIRLLKSEDNR